MSAKRFRTLFRLSIPVCLLAGLVLAAAGAAPAGTAAAAPTGAPEWAHAATPYVVTTTADEFGTGIGCSLREAIQSVNTNADFGGCTGNGDIISLPAGTYTLTGAANEDDNASGDLDIKGNLIINGADEKTTFIQAGTNATNGVDRVMHIFEGYTVEINDVTIRYGKAPDGVMAAGNSTCDGSGGGGIYVRWSATLTLNDCVVAYNRAGDGGAGCASYGYGGEGGGIYARATLELNNTSVRNNESGAGGIGALGNPAHRGGDGGGIYLTQGEATLTDSWINSNVTGAGGQGADVVSGTAGNGAWGGYGGGICITSSSTLTLTNTLVAGNTTGDGGDGGDSAGGDGGNGGTGGIGAGIYSGGTLVVIESVIDGNATGLGGSGGSGTGSNGDGGDRGDGGGIYNNVETATLSESTIRDNVAGYGGGLYSYNGTMTLDGCTVSGNTASWNGGGLNGTGSSTIMLTNSTISGNDAYVSGGGISGHSSSGTVMLTFVTVTDNTADLDDDGSGAGGGLQSSGTLTMTNTIVAKNYDKGGENPDCFGTVASGDYNLLGIGDSAGCTFTPQPHDQVGTTASPIDPLLGLLGDNGGPTLTHAIKSNSPAVDQIPAGVNGCAMGSLDQRGALRFPPCDIGAYEIGAESVYLPLVVRD